MIIVTEETFDSVLVELATKPYLSLDTETTGLRPYHGHRLFCIAFATESDEYYFNFHPDHPHYLDHKRYLPALQVTLSLPNVTYFLHNAKFDMAILLQEGLRLCGDIHDTMVAARVLQNDKFKYDLDTCAQEIGAKKDDAVKEYIMEHDLWDWLKIPGKAKAQKDLYYAKVPYDIVAPYACRDVRITYDLGMHQLQRFSEIDNKESWNFVTQKNIKAVDSYGSVLPAFVNEKLITKTTFDMEAEGIPIDVSYCESALAYERGKAEGIAHKLSEAAGIPFVDSAKFFLKVFKDEDIEYGKPSKKTKRISPKFDSDALSKFKNPLAKEVITYRDAKNRGDFYANFLWCVDNSGLVHCNFNQAQTKTGRFSSSEPNLQNLTSEEDERDQTSPFLVRRAFLPPKDFFLFMPDYDQMEYRLMLDLAGAKDLIAKINGGLDVHQATAEIAGITRSEAKTVNFGVLYGLGDPGLAKNLGTSLNKAKEIKRKIFDAAPEVKDFIEGVSGAAQARGFTFNWMSRRYYFPEPKWCYKAPNYVIQGGCADLVKVAMNRCHAYLQSYRSKLLLTIHDELVFKIYKNEAEVMPHLKNIMEDVYSPRNGLKLTCSVEHSFKNLADKTKGYPSDELIRSAFL